MVPALLESHRHSLSDLCFTCHFGCAHPDWLSRGCPLAVLACGSVASFSVVILAVGLLLVFVALRTTEDKRSSESPEHDHLTRAGVNAVTVGCSVASVALTWTVTGDLSYQGEVHGGLDYMFRAPAALDTWMTVVAIPGALYLVWVLPQLMRQPDVASPAFLVVFSSAGVALIGRVVTAGVIGANIGGGIALLFGLPAVLLTLWISAFSLCCRRRVEAPTLRWTRRIDTRSDSGF